MFLPDLFMHQIKTCSRMTKQWRFKLIRFWKPGLQFIRNRLVPCPPLTSLSNKDIEETNYESFSGEKANYESFSGEQANYESFPGGKTNSESFSWEKTRAPPVCAPLGEKLGPHKIPWDQAPARTDKEAHTEKTLSRVLLWNIEACNKVWITHTFSHSSAIQSQCHSKRWTIACCWHCSRFHEEDLYEGEGDYNDAADHLHWNWFQC